jgi:hypothetical protein
MDVTNLATTQPFLCDFRVFDLPLKAPKVVGTAFAHPCAIAPFNGTS